MRNGWSIRVSGLGHSFSLVIHVSRLHRDGGGRDHLWGSVRSLIAVLSPRLWVYIMKGLVDLDFPVKCKHEHTRYSTWFAMYHNQNVVNHCSHREYLSCNFVVWQKIPIGFIEASLIFLHRHMYPFLTSWCFLSKNRQVDLNDISESSSFSFTGSRLTTNYNSCLLLEFQWVHYLPMLHFPSSVPNYSLFKMYLLAVWQSLKVVEHVVYSRRVLIFPFHFPVQRGF